MPSLSSLLAPVAVTAGLAGLWLQAPVESLSNGRPLPPLAALAWAQANCNSMLTARDGTPRVQAEDLMRVASMFDTVRAREGEAVACRQATRISLKVAQGTEQATATSVRALLVSLNLAK